MDISIHMHNMELIHTYKCMHDDIQMPAAYTASYHSCTHHYITAFCLALFSMVIIVKGLALIKLPGS